MDGLNKAIRILDKVSIFNRSTSIIGLAILFLMVLLTFIDVFMRYLFNSPIPWVTEIVEIMMIMAIFFSVAYTQNNKGHVTVDLITLKLTPKVKIAVEFVTTMLGLGIFVIIIWQNIAVIPWILANNTTHSQSFLVSKAPFHAIIAMASTALWLVLLQDLLRNVAESIKLGFKWHQRLLTLGISAIIIVVVALWIQPTLWSMALPTAGLLGIIVCLILILMGMPISFALLLTSFMFITHVRGLNIAFDTMTTDIYRTTGSYSWSVVNFFVMLGFICLHARFGVDLYYAFYKWIGHMRGGLAMATVGACTGFAAIVGDVVSAVATMGTVSLPEMKRYEYNNTLSAGSVCGGALLGPIIPPSVTFILYGLVTHMSIGKLFVAGIVPGLILAIVFCVIIYSWCRLKPNFGPPGERAGWGPRFVSLKAGGPVMILFILVIGGIYMGVFTPTEGGSIGAMVAFLLGLVMKRFTWKSIAQMLADSGKVISMTFLIVIGAVMFTRLMAWCNISDTVSEFFISAGLSPQIFMIVVIGIFFLLGCVMDIVPLLLVGIPIVHPIAVSMGIDPIWFAVLMVLTINTGALTPPIGMILFVFKGTSKDIPMKEIYLGALPFTLGTLLVIFIVFAVPFVATWLPGILT